MAQNYICDAYNKHVEPDPSFALWPQGWYSVMVRNGPTRHACQPQCLIALALADEQKALPQPKEVPDGAVSSL